MPPALSIAVRRTPCCQHDGLLAQMAFGYEKKRTDVVHHGLKPTDGVAAFETLHKHEPMSAASRGAVSWRTDNRLLSRHATVTLNADIENVTDTRYRRVLTCARAAGFAHLIRVWHFLPRINDSTGAAERDKRFCPTQLLVSGTTRIVAYNMPAPRA